MKTSTLPLVWLAMASAALANTPPTVVIQSAAMRPGTTLMDVVYRVNDPDDATVKTRALAFVDGTRSFAKVLKPVTFVEGTAVQLGDAIPTNADHKVTWDVGADWNIDLGKVKFEVLAMDQRGLLPFDWITIPAAGGKPAVTVSKDGPTDAQVLNAYFWQYAAGDSGLSVANGVLRGAATSGVFKSVGLVNGARVQAYGAPFIFKRMNLAAADPIEINHAIDARAVLHDSYNWHAVNRPYDGVTIVDGWGNGDIPAGLNGVTAISAGGRNELALMSDGTVIGWSPDSDMFYKDVPAGLSGVTAIAAGAFHNLALKSDGTVVQWGGYVIAVPAGLSGVTAIAAGLSYSLALKNDGHVVGWGDNKYGQTTVPAGLSGVIAIAAGATHCLALKSDGTVVGWGDNAYGKTTIPSGLSGVTAIAAGEFQSLALKSNGTVVVWGDNTYGQTNVPAGLSGVTAITSGNVHNVALKSDGTVVVWGYKGEGVANVPAGLSGVIAISAGPGHTLALKAKAP